MAKKTSRIEIRADEEFVEAIARIAEQTHKSRADIIREALNLYHMAMNERLQNNRGIVFRDLDDSSRFEQLKHPGSAPATARSRSDDS